jgi:Putative ATP-dependent DNA helicase recG C-terminal
MFDDKLIIESPGGFPPLVTPQNIYDMHQPRNPHLMDAMFYMRYVQAAHEGTRRMRDTMKQMGLPEPIFLQKEMGSTLVQVLLKIDIEHRKVFVDSDAFRALGPSVANSLSEYERRIINFVVENRTINVTQASNLIGRRWHSTKKILTALGQDVEFLTTCIAIQLREMPSPTTLFQRDSVTASVSLGPEMANVRQRDNPVILDISARRRHLSQIRRVEEGKISFKTWNPPGEVSPPKGSWRRASCLRFVPPGPWCAVG